MKSVHALLTVFSLREAVDLIHSLFPAYACSLLDPHTSLLLNSSSVVNCD